MQAQPNSVQSGNQKQGQQPYGYFDALSGAFQRIWKNKTLWIWGIFLTAGGGGFFSNIGNSPEIEERSALAEFWWIIPIAIGIGFLIGIVFWIFSTIVRPGVIRALDRLQNNENSKAKHRDIWEQGKSRFIEIIKLDLIIFLVGIGIMMSFVIAMIIIALFIGAGMAFSGGIVLIVLAILLGVAFFVIFILSIIVVSIIRRIGVVFVSLGDMNWLTVIKTSYFLIKNNKMETFKIILINILISMVGGVIGMVVIGIISVVLIGLSFAIMLALKPLGIFLMVISGIIIIVIFLLLKSFISLWSQDVVIWWVKKMQGIEVSQEKVTEKNEELINKEVEADSVTSQGDLVLENEN